MSKATPLPQAVTPIEDDEPPAPTAPARDADPFDPAALRLAPDFEAVGVRRVLTAVPVRKPGKQEFVRVHPGEDYRLETGLIELKEDREFYLVHPDLRPELAEELVLVRLHLAVSRAGSVFLWYVRLPEPDGKRSPWHDSAERAALLATRQWVRLVPNQAAGAYDTYIASAALPEPEWPDLTLRELLELAFGERYIRSVDPPVVRRPRGLA
ncbi:MAG TPA: hypothetical protein VFY87_25625 [Geminicoccaceae bacterium]|nr:hypothetical protein [Geminicoccaceae bacterium]